MPAMITVRRLRRSVRHLAVTGVLCFPLLGGAATGSVAVGGPSGAATTATFSGADAGGGHAARAVRPPCCAGSWYPDQPAALAGLVDSLLAQARPAAGLGGPPAAVICPHAGYRFSAPVAAAAYASLRGRGYRRVIVLAFSHRRAGGYRGIDVPSELAAYATPLGEVPLDRAACQRLLGEPLFGSHPGLGAGEHSLELQLPFLQRALGTFRLVPLLVGQLSDRECAAAARAILPLVDDGTLLVASSDFTHFGPDYGHEPFAPGDDVPQQLGELAEQAAAPILRCDYDGFTAHLARSGDTICGRGPIRLLLRILSMQGGAAAVRAARDTSGRLLGDWTNSVTYQSFVFARRPGALDAAERAQLLTLARRTITTYLNGEPPPHIDPATLPAALAAGGSCFVTLEHDGRLRGCIGNMAATGPLFESVIQNAISACRDPRFVANPVTAAEVEALHLEISYLTPMRRVTSIDSIVVGRHGLLITLGRRRGVLLPQVAYERGWTRAEFLDETCRKAGLPPGAWQRPQAEIDSFEAEVFGEPER